MLDSDDIVNAIIDSTGHKIFGAGEWQECKYNLKQRKGWLKLHIVIDRKIKKIIASELTTNHVGNVTPASELLNKVNQDIATKNIANINAIAIIPPKDNAALTDHCIKNIPCRAANINSITAIGKQKWQQVSGYNWRSLVETTTGRYKKIIVTMIYSKKIKKTNLKLAAIFSIKLRICYAGDF